LGTASAIAILMTVLILIVSVIIVRLGERGQEDRA
jgi:ABC-type sugar transport system permease subunit